MNTNPNLAINRDYGMLFHRFSSSLAKAISDWNAFSPRQTIGLFEGHRTFDRQRYLYSVGRDIPGHPCRHKGDAAPRPIGTCNLHPMGLRVTNAMEGLSWHNYGVAADVVFDADWQKPGLQPSWDSRFPWDEMGAHFQRHGFEWAGSWKSFPEKPHVQMAFGLTINEALELFKQGGLRVVWEAMG